MVIAVSILQANVNHCVAAQDLLIQTATQWKIDVAIVAEPYYVRDRDDWAGDRDDSVAIVAWRRTGPAPFESVTKGRGWVLTSLGDVVVIGVYFAPSRSFAEFERMLAEVGALVVDVHPTPVVVAGDFNAKSRTWGSPATDLRGETLADWAVSTGLVLLNRGTVQTCVRSRGGSIVDLSFASPALARRTRSEAAIVERWVANGTTSSLDADERCERLVGALTRVCDAAMRRAGPALPRTRVYWWRPHLAGLRTTCQMARRRYTRSRRRNSRDFDQEEILLAAYRAARAALTSAIKAAKEEAWKEWLDSLIPGRVLAHVVPVLKEETLALLSECLASGRIPRRWKKGKLVLLRKHGRPADSPSAYRPIVLLDEASKLFERVLAARLVAHMEAVGPDLSGAQFGFRRRRSTVDAITRLRDMVEEVVGQGGVLLAVSLDIANAFNTIPWTTIAEALRYHRVPGYLRRVLADYFVDRAIFYPAQDQVVRRDMTCGVPQGSVLGPLLWNIGYDWVLRGANLRGVGVICYADDTLITASGPTFRDAGVLATAGTAHVVRRIRALAGTAHVVRRIRALGLNVALEKSEAMFFHRPRTKPPRGYSIVVSGTPIAVGGTMKYLGLILDSRWGFSEHFRTLAPKLVTYAGMLTRLLPNCGGAG
ncbi:PREDICTED: uncharacterized protein LOC106104438, partial [Papilio polytes]|uniref:uncharacterized protein LOC106104438 n=1 Tax=Papilio polytes TaxID=76194 RepID=UPI000676669F